MIHEEIVTFEVAKLAKEKGFPVKEIECWYCEYDGRPTKEIVDEQQYPIISQSLLQRWLREKNGIIVEVFVDDDSNMPLTYNIHQYKDWNWVCVCHHHGNYYAVNDWELCLEDALKYTLEKLI